MFCPKCGKADQAEETYCRQCGTYLPDLSKPVIAAVTPEQHIKANVVLGSMTVVTCLTLAVLLYLFFLGLPEAPSVIYVMFGLLIAMAAWHVQTVWRSLLLRKHLIEKKVRREDPPTEGLGPTTGKLLDQANFENVIPASVTDHTTKHLTEPHKRSS
jgi:hypothetical protein